MTEYYIRCMRTLITKGANEKFVEPAVDFLSRLAPGCEDDIAKRVRERLDEGHVLALILVGERIIQADWDPTEATHPRNVLPVTRLGV